MLWKRTQKREESKTVEVIHLLRLLQDLVDGVELAVEHYPHLAHRLDLFQERPVKEVLLCYLVILRTYFQHLMVYVSTLMAPKVQKRGPLS